MIFYKTVSAGNDFLHIAVEDLAEFVRTNNGRAPGVTGVTGVTDISKTSKGRLAQCLCQRQTGAGADGVTFYSVGEQEVQFEIFNRDGSEAELSGNGMAGVSALLFYLGKFKDRLVLNTRTGPRTHFLLEQDDADFKLKIEIGSPDFHNTAFFPFLEPGQYAYTHENIRFHPVSVGNPHVVVLLEKELPDDHLERMGKMLEGAGIFPNRTNVELVFFRDREDCRVFYYERGVGRTVSSSTGSAAVFAVLQKLGSIRAQEHLTIATPAGKIKIFGNASIAIENYSKIVYKGFYVF
jgi:diaminopimelate epimerase